ncbi:unnamed protein product [Aspergillus oryzae]|nr:unnamed protein product [Aspergillus oryzae]GMF83215.1 unnamed protein product [Aspergillus oryzae]
MDSGGKEAVGNVQRAVVEDTKVVLKATDERILWDEKQSRAVVRKFDLRLLSLFTVINLFSFIDRVNIGNARLLGLEKDLGLSGLRFNIALMCLFVSYCVVELPSNILCKIVGGHIYIPTLVLCFGIITMLTSLVEQKGGLYRRHELGVRTSIYISASSASGAFGGLLAIGLSRIPDWGLIHTWRNIFFFEVGIYLPSRRYLTVPQGLVSVILAVVAFISIPSGPETARFLTESQKQVAVDRMRIDSAGTTEHSRTTFRHVVQGLTTPPIVFCALGFFFGK